MLEPRKIRQFLAAAIILAGISLVAVIAGKFSGGRTSAPPETGITTSADLALRKVTFTETKDGKRRWELLADSADYDRGAGITRLKGVRMQVAGDRNTGDIILTAKQADYNTESKDVRLSGNVLVRTQSGLEVATDAATYSNSSALVRTDMPVRIAIREMTVTGAGLELNTITRSLHILRNVEANLKGGAAR
jgi:LPS export ABC transporter protein LptC